jgi:hypothetical protein
MQGNLSKKESRKVASKIYPEPLAELLMDPEIICRSLLLAVAFHAEEKR